MAKKQHQHDVLVIGSGAAGLTLALSLADHAKVAVLSKGPLNEGSTWFAQGGIAAVLDSKDSIEDHVADTLSPQVPACAMKIACVLPWKEVEKRYSG